MKYFYVGWMIIASISLSGCLTESPIDQANQIVNQVNDTVEDSINQIGNLLDEIEDEIENNSDGSNEEERADEQDKETFPTLDVANDVNFSGDLRTISVDVNNPLASDVYVNIYRNYRVDDDNNYILNYEDRIVATAIIEGSYEGELFITPDITKLLVEVISLDDNRIIIQQPFNYPFENISL